MTRHKAAQYISYVPLDDHRGAYFLVRVPVPGSPPSKPVYRHKIYTVHAHGVDRALLLAMQARDALLRELWPGDSLRWLTCKPFTQPRCDNTTGKLGVCCKWNKSGSFAGFQASWQAGPGVAKGSKQYSCGPLSELSYEEAFILACRIRDEKTGQPVLDDDEYLALLNPDLDTSPR